MTRIDINKKELFNFVIKRLNETTNLKDINVNTITNHVMIAGGAVSNLIYEYYHGVPAVINDIDVFIQPKLTNPKNSTSDISMSVTDENGYENLGIGIIETKRDGFFNKIYTFIPHDITMPFTSKYHKEILNRFDLNCCKAGINLNKKKLILDDAFIDFIKTKEIKINKDFMNLFSFARALKKINDLKAVFYKEEVLEKIYLIHLANNGFKSFNIIDEVYITSENTNRMFITRKYQSILLENEESLISKFYTIGVVPGTKNRFYIQAIKEKVPDKWKFILELRNDEIPFVKDFFFKQNRWNLKNAYMNRLGLLISNNFFSGFFFCHPSNLITKQHERQLKTLDNFYKQDFSEASLKKINGNLLGKHSLGRFNVFLLTKGYSVNDIIKVYQTIQKSRIQKSIIGVCESIDDKTPTKILDALSKKNIPEFVKNIEVDIFSHLDKEIIKKLPIENGFSKILRELNTKLNLMEEGAEMHHCVGGYEYQLKRGNMRIFSMNFKGEKSTLALMLDRNGVWYVNQHKGLSNKKPSKTHLKISKAFVSYLKYRKEEKITLFKNNVISKLSNAIF